MEYFFGSFSRIYAPSVTPTITPNVVLSRTSGIGPLGISFDATGTTSTQTTMPFEDLLVLWDFGDDDAPTWAYGARPGVLKKNHATGGIANHVYETPGTYTWTATFYDGASLASLSGSVTVSNPDTVYAGSATICVSSSGLPVAGINGVPAGAQCYQLATIELATAKITGTNQRLLLCRGDSFTVSATNNLPTYAGLTIGAYGTGAKPLVTFIGSTINYGAIAPKANDCRIMDLQATTAFTGTYTARMSSGSVDHFLMFRIDAVYISSLLESGGNYNVVSECTLDQPGGGSGHVGVWFEGTIGTGIMGCSVTNCTNIEHNIRTQDARWAYFANNTLVNNASTKWLHAYRGDQTHTHYSEYAVICDSLYDQGASVTAQGMQIAPQNTSVNERFRNIIFERNVMYQRSGGTSTGFISISAQRGIRIRNNILHFLGGNGWGIVYDDGSTNVTDQGTEFAIENNTMYCGVTGGLSFIWLKSAKSPLWTGGRVTNNLMYSPLSTKTGANNGTQATLFYVSTGLTSPANYVVNNNSTDTQVKNVPPLFVATPPVALTDWGLQSGSYARNSGLQVPVLEDFFGTARTGTMDMGAVSS